MDPSTPPARGSTLARGTMIGRYRLLEFRGRGGMGEVYLAEDTALHRRVAIKRVADRLGGTEKHRERVLREARRASRLSDPRIVAVHDVLDHGGEIFLVMEFVEGTSLREGMKDPMSLEAFWDLALECTKALESAHRQGIVHRDVKPENIMLTHSGQVKILDFGIARRSFAEEWETTTVLSPDDERVAGTPMYMPPEAHLGRPLDARADIFSLGVLFYELLAGGRPFVSETPRGLVNQILHEDPAPLDSVRPEVPEPLARLVGRMLAKKAEDRPASAAQVLESLVGARRGESLSVSPAGTRRPIRLVPLAAGLALAAVVVLAALGGADRLLGYLGLRSLPQTKNLAVLPFEVTGDEPNEASFGLGLAAALVSALSRDAPGGALQVIPIEEVQEELGDDLSGKEGRKDKEVAARARAKLGVNLILSGSLRKEGDSLRVDLKLVDTASSRTVRRKTTSMSLERFPRLVEAIRELLEASRGDSLAASVAFARRHRWGSFYFRGMGDLLQAGDEAAVEGSIHELEMAVSLNPENPLARSGLARAFYKAYGLTGDPSWLDRSVEAGRKAVQIDPHSAEAQKSLGLALQKTGSSKDLGEGRRALRRAVALNPGDDEAVYEFARSYGRKGDFATEDSLFAAAVERRPGYWRAHWWQATSLYKQGRFQEAIAPFRKTAALSPDFYKSYSNLGAIYLSLGRYDLAVDVCEKSARLNPSFSAYSNLATAQFYHRDFEQAAGNYKKALEYDFEEYAGWMNLGDVYYWGFQNPENARDAYENAVEFGEKEYRKRPYDNVLLADLAMVQPKLGNPDSARTRIERALQRASSNPVVLYDAALTRWQLGDTASALSALERAVAKGYPPKLIEDSAVFDGWREEPRFRSLFPAPETKAGDDPTQTQEVQDGES